MSTWIWNPSVCDELCEQDAEAPDIRLDGELRVVGSLRRRPLDRESSADSSLVFVFLDQPENKMTRKLFISWICKSSLNSTRFLNQIYFAWAVEQFHHTTVREVKSLLWFVLFTVIDILPRRDIECGECFTDFGKLISSLIMFCKMT